MKLSMSGLLNKKSLYSQFSLEQAVRTFEFFHDLKTGEWEQENLPRFGEISAISELKHRSFTVVLNLMEKFFTDENFLEYDEMVPNDCKSVSDNGNSDQDSEIKEEILLRTKLIKLSTEWYE